MTLPQFLARQQARYDAGEPLEPMDDATWAAFGPWLAEQADVRLARLAEIVPGPGFDTLRRSDQDRYDRLLAEIGKWRGACDLWVTTDLARRDAALNDSAARADLAALAFTRELELLR